MNAASCCRESTRGRSSSTCAKEHAIALAGEASVDECSRACGHSPRWRAERSRRRSRRESRTSSDAGWTRVAVVDYGCKRSIPNRLAWAGAAVTVYPHDVDADELARYDGVLLSNGPGDPAPSRTSNTVQLVGRVPMLGICLGHQLLALADGVREVQAPVRPPRGPTIRVVERATGRVLVTSQNHGFAVAPSEAREATHVSLYDGTVEGLDFPDLRARSVQFHPEAGPGPHDAWGLLDRWLKEVGGLAEAAWTSSRSA